MKTFVEFLEDIRHTNSLSLFFRFVDIAVKRLSKLNSIPQGIHESFLHDRSVIYFDKKPEFRPFHEWLESYGVKNAPLSPPYKEGGEGVAYFVGNDRVVKFINNDEDAEMASLCIHSDLHDVVTMKDIVVVGPYYAIMQEEVATTNFPTGIVNAGYLLKIYIKEHQELISQQNAQKYLSSDEIEDYVNIKTGIYPEGQMAWYKSQMEKMKPYIILLSQCIFRILDKTGRLWLDMHHDNFGFGNDKWKIFDTGYSALIWHKEIPEIRRILG